MMKTSFAAPSPWWNVARNMVIVLVILQSLLGVGALLVGLLLLYAAHGRISLAINICPGQGLNTCWLSGVGDLFFLISIPLIVGAALCWWAVRALRRGSNTARWILGLLAGFGVLSGLLGVLQTGGISAVWMLYNGLIVYGLLLDPKVREAFGNGSVESMVTNVWK
jgi:hypothetical protein